MSGAAGLNLMGMGMVKIAQPWDLAGPDGLEVARALVGETVDHLAPFQSMETVLAGESCAVLRMCDRAFRLTYPGPLDQLVTPLQRQVWLKQLPWMGAVALPAQVLPHLAARATVRAPHRLEGLPLHRAVPATLGTIPVLLWHHPIGAQPALELHLAHTQIEPFRQWIQSIPDGSVSLTTAHP